MTPNQIRRLDAIIGRSLCFCLTLVKRAHEFFFPPPPSPADPHKILFLKLIEQGATVLAIPAIRQAIKRVGREQVYFMVFDENQEILHILDLVPRTNILTVRQGGIVIFCYDLLKSLWRVHRLQIDVVIDMEFLPGLGNHRLSYRCRNEGGFTPLHERRPLPWGSHDP